MPSVEETIAALRLAYDDNLISEEELNLVILYDEIIKNKNFKHSYFPYTEYEPLNWENYDSLTCKIELRCEKSDNYSSSTRCPANS